MFSQLGDNLVTLDGLREAHKLVSLEHFGLTGDPAQFDENVRKLILAHLERYDTHMGSYLKYAHVALAYMTLEDRLYAFGGLMSATHRGSSFIPAKKEKGSLLDKFERYLEANKISSPLAGAAEPLRLVRNCIVHSRGCVSDYSEGDKLRAILPTLIGVTTNAQDRLFLTAEGCLLLQETVVQYVSAINSAARFRLWTPPEVQKNFEKYILPHLSEASADNPSAQ